jgi:hypothetical protein
MEEGADLGWVYVTGSLFSGTLGELKDTRKMQVSVNRTVNAGWVNISFVPRCGRHSPSRDEVSMALMHDDPPPADFCQSLESMFKEA